VSELDRFERGLAGIIGRPTDLRPFVCEGSPLDCPVFIVGYNPATTLDGDWWRFWMPGHGYRKTMWWDAYRAHRTQPSKTRSRIEAIVASLPGVRVLEANIDARPSARKSAYPRPVTAPFDYLLGQCRPRVIIAHGVDAVAHLQDWGRDGRLIACPHFIYVGQAQTQRILAEVREALGLTEGGAAT
jgi:hypothetical protein